MPLFDPSAEPGDNPIAPAAPAQDSVVLATADFDTARGLAGVSADEWPDATVSQPPYLGAATLEAQRRIPCDWSLLDSVSQQNLRLGLIYQIASLIVPAANPAKTEDFKVGSFTLKTDDTPLLGDADTLMGWANQYYSAVVLPSGILPLAVVDAYARPVIRKASVGKRRPFGWLR